MRDIQVGSGSQFKIEKSALAEPNKSCHSLAAAQVSLNALSTRRPFFNRSPHFFQSGIKPERRLAEFQLSSEQACPKLTRRVRIANVNCLVTRTPPLTLRVLTARKPKPIWTETESAFCTIICRKIFIQKNRNFVRLFQRPKRLNKASKYRNLA